MRMRRLLRVLVRHPRVRVSHGKDAAPAVHHSSLHPGLGMEGPRAHCDRSTIWAKLGIIRPLALSLTLQAPQSQAAVGLQPQHPSLRHDLLAQSYRPQAPYLQTARRYPVVRTLSSIPITPDHTMVSWRIRLSYGVQRRLPTCPLQLSRVQEPQYRQVPLAPARLKCQGPVTRPRCRRPPMSLLRKSLNHDLRSTIEA